MNYFLLPRINDHSHPITVQPSNQLPMRTMTVSVLSFLVCAAIHAGARIIIAIKMMAMIYFKMTIKFPSICFYFGRGDASPRRYFYIPYLADAPSSSSIRINWLYFAIRSVRDIEPVLICPAFVATARSAIVVSSVSPLRWEIITP